MKNNSTIWITLTLIASISFSPLAQARVDTNAPEISNENQQSAPPPVYVDPGSPYGDLSETYDDEDDVEPYGTPVHTSENSAEKAKKREFWRNIILATAAVIVATVSILVVSNNNGKDP